MRHFNIYCNVPKHIYTYLFHEVLKYAQSRRDALMTSAVYGKQDAVEYIDYLFIVSGVYNTPSSVSNDALH